MRVKRFTKSNVAFGLARTLFAWFSPKHPNWYRVSFNLKSLAIEIQ